jgi:hypothetical protein
VIRIKWLLLLTYLLCFGILLVPHAHAAENNPYSWDESGEYIDPTIRLGGEAMGAFEDAIKSYILYTASQHVPGSKESGVGYYYNNKKKKMKRVLFWRVGSGYARRTDRPLDFAIRGTGFFVIELPGGWTALHMMAGLSCKVMAAWI